MLIYILFVDLHNLFLGVSFSIVSFSVSLALFKAGIHRLESHFKNISKSTVDIQKLEVNFDDGVKSTGFFYRSVSETKLTPDGRRYDKPRPTVIFFHGFWTRKEVNEINLINLAHMGYVAVAFDQRGHGEAGGNKAEWYKLYTDVDNILDLICSIEDVRKGSLCCIGKSMGGTSVLTKCYQDERVAMVIGISALHDVEILTMGKFPFLSSGWFVKHVISKVKDDETLKLCAHYFLKNDPKFNKNRVYLIHGELDNIFPPSLTFELNKKQARIPEDHAILLKNCGHSMEGQESLIFGIILKWILENTAMKLN
ncbi:MAG: alpha/beta hydrolase family protein [Promethearchaeota archaeon]